jgi:hypothetical protein
LSLARGHCEIRAAVVWPFFETSHKCLERPSEELGRSARHSELVELCTAQFLRWSRASVARLPPAHPATFFAFARIAAQRFLAAFEILALAAADITRFFTTCTFLDVECPKLFAFAWAHLFLAAMEIFALPAADSTRFFVLFNSRPAACPRAFPAALTPSSCCCNLPSCFSSFRSSRLIAARIFIKSSTGNLSQPDSVALGRIADDK